ncbi:signal peptide peptidase SppA [Parvularcula marina]|uniref:Signal peptide peptidase SppA n=1 Tax=Parvularcula marina TaxID=2292771 RepID=A0A371REU2_9PROT|nr:signal peptide peptidase SppA [Parvularcula marina]
MDGERNRLTVWGFLKGLFKAVIGLSLLAQSLLFLLILVTLISITSNASKTLSGASGEGPSLEVPDNGALLLNPRGVLVETAPPEDTLGDALAAAFGARSENQISVHELVRVLRSAAEDDRIDVLVLDLQGLYVPSIYASKAHYVAAEVEKFRATGKRVIAIGDYYSQEQYLIASEADTILLNDFGGLEIIGYGSYGTFFKSALDKLKVKSNVFRVGTFKAAVEPFLRDDMSEEAKLANRAYLGVLWDQYALAVDENRDLQTSVKTYANNTGELMREAGNNVAMAALNAGLVDQLMNRPDQIEFIASLVGRDDNSKYGGFRGVGYETYKVSAKTPEIRKDSAKIAVVTAAGTIVDGDEPYGVAAGDTIARQLREARFNNDVRALVLRVDSPGGSAFASEVMRDELLKLKEAGKPVVVSMGSLAASGGYWISASADEIWAAPTTVTGSIGVFGYVPTFEDTLAEVGVFTDGVGTTPLAAISAAGMGPLPEAYGEIIQASIEDVYRRFTSLVAEGRGMSVERVDEIGQGRVWIGATAIEIGLVDKLGTIDDAIASAASRAGVEDYDVIGMTRPKTPFEKFLENLAGAEVDAHADVAAQMFGGTSSRSVDMTKLVRFALEEGRFLLGFNDPQGVYVRCLQCPVAY